MLYHAGKCDRSFAGWMFIGFANHRLLFHRNLFVTWSVLLNTVGWSSLVSFRWTTGKRKHCTPRTAAIPTTCLYPTAERKGEEGKEKEMEGCEGVGKGSGEIGH